MLLNFKQFLLLEWLCGKWKDFRLVIEVAFVVKAGKIVLVCKLSPDCIYTMRKSTVLINNLIRIILELLKCYRRFHFLIFTFKEKKSQSLTCPVSVFSPNFDPLVGSTF